jgi:hypothetical protein
MPKNLIIKLISMSFLLGGLGTIPGNSKYLQFMYSFRMIYSSSLEKKLNHSSRMNNFLSTHIDEPRFEPLISQIAQKFTTRDRTSAAVSTINPAEKLLNFCLSNFITYFVK